MPAPPPTSAAVACRGSVWYWLRGVGDNQEEGTTEMLQALMNVTIVIFMVGNLMEVGLRLKIAEALAALRMCALW